MRTAHRAPALLLLCAASVYAEPKPYFTEPAMAPNRPEIAFVSGGDIWTVPANGGEAHLLVSHPATESRPAYSPDGSKLAFVSTRTGAGDIYVLTFATGDLKRITYDDGLEQLDGWSPDGKYLYFSTGSHDISSMQDIYRVSAEGGTPMPVSADRYASEYFAAPAPDGKTLAFTARGIVSAQWWRNGHSHLDESEIWIRRDGTYERADGGGAKNVWPMWSADGKALYFVSSRTGSENIWEKPLSGAPKQITHFEKGRVLWPKISYDGRIIVFERDFRIWKLDPAKGAAAPVEITLRGSPASQGTAHAVMNDRFQHLSLSHDGRKVAFAARGNIFAASSHDGGPAVRIPGEPAPVSGIAWAPGNRSVIYTVEKGTTTQLVLYDFTKNAAIPLTNGGVNSFAPVWSPDGTSILYSRGPHELHIIDAATKQDRMLAKNVTTQPPFDRGSDRAFSRDGKWIAYVDEAERGFERIMVVPAAGGNAQPVSFLADSNHGSISWSADGSYLLFVTGQRTEPGRVARIDLAPRTPRFREDRFQELFKEEVPRKGGSGTDGDAAKPADDAKTGIVFEGIRERLSLLPLGIDVASAVLSPDGQTLLLNARSAGQSNLYTYPLDEFARERPAPRQITSTPGFKSNMQFSPDGKDVFYLDAGHIQSVNLETRTVKSLAVTAEVDSDFDTEKMQVFQQAWNYLASNFFDEKFHGVDWAAMQERFEAVIAGTRTTDEMRRVINLMIGELNASHSGIGPAPQSIVPAVGKPGLLFDAAEYEKSGHLKVAEVIALSPAALTQKIKPGDYILAVDGVKIAPGVNFDQLLEHKIDRKVVLQVADTADGANLREASLRPVNNVTEKNLLYRQWVEGNRAYVERASGGKLGYVHMFDMSEQSLEQLEVDLDAGNQTKSGVVVDVRNNNGGFVNAYAIDIFARHNYLNMAPRDHATRPARSNLGQRLLDRPTVLVTNQHSLSDAEDFTEGYRALKLGKVVGEPTAGWIIYTSNMPLLDDSSLRLPFIRITDGSGKDMEMHPRPVDIPVVRPIGESYTGRDSQLDAAIKELLAEMK